MRLTLACGAFSKACASVPPVALSSFSRSIWFTMVMVPVNLTWLIWGWPNRFIDRMASAGSRVILIGPYRPGDAGTSGIDTPEQAAAIPAGFSGYVWTNEIATIAPLVRHRN